MLQTLLTCFICFLGILQTSGACLGACIRVETTGRTTAVGAGEPNDAARSDDTEDSDDIFLGIVGAVGIPDNTEASLVSGPVLEAEDASFVSDPVLDAEESLRLRVPNNPSKSGCNAAFRASLARTSAS